MIIRTMILLTAIWGAVIYPLHGLLSAEDRPVLAQRPSVLVLYTDEGEYASMGELHAVNIANLAGRHAEATLAAISAYQAEDRNAHDALIVVNASYTQTVPDALVRDVMESGQDTMWIQYGGYRIDATPTVEVERPAEPEPEITSSVTASLTAQVGWLAEQVTTEAFGEVVYRGEAFEREAESTTSLSRIRITDPDRVEVLAELRNAEGETIPWAVRQDNLIYVTESPMPFAGEDDRYLVFADILSRMLVPDLPQTRHALLRIEDIGPEADPVTLRELTASLEALEIPFSATVYDTFRDPNGHFSNGHAREFGLIDRPHLTRALRDMVRARGTLIMHGHTHQHGSMANPHYGTSGGDYEFFRAGLDQVGHFRLIGPLENDAPEDWDARLQTALANWQDAGLPRPWAHTVPHYAATVSAYDALGSHFPVRFERVLYFAGEAHGEPDYSSRYTDQFFPYPVRDIRGDVILPETLGNWAMPGSIHGRSAEDMLASARRNLVLRDAWAGFFYHWYLPPDQLEVLVTGLEEMGYVFVGPETAAAVIPAEGTLPGRPRHDEALQTYRDEIDGIEFWFRDQTELIILGLVILAHLIVFRIGPRRRKVTRS